MKHPSSLPSIAALSLAFLLPAYAQSGSAQTSQDPQSASAPIRGSRQAMRMVPARAALKQPLNADKMRPGSQFRATLVKKVQLLNGPELPSGTLLLGEVVADDMDVAGTSKLALRFTQADLKDGQIVPIKATIVGVYPPESTDSSGNTVSSGDVVPNSWNDGTLQVDQIGVVSGVDLHSKIASRNSGVFVSSTKDNVKLAAGSEIALALAARGQGDGNMSGNGSSTP